MDTVGELLTRIARSAVVEAVRAFRDRAEDVIHAEWFEAGDASSESYDDLFCANRALDQLRYGWMGDWYGT